MTPHDVPVQMWPMLAYVFPGQGAQGVGEGRDVFDEYEVVRRTFEEADDALGYSIAGLCFDGPPEELKLTRNAQPALLTLSVAVLRVLQRETELVPSFVTGHSLGEYSALVCADAIPFVDAVRLVHERGVFMQEAVPSGEGAMAAVMGVLAERVEAWCAEAAGEELVTASNYNGPAQTVVSGHRTAVERVIARAKAERAVAKLLEVSAPFHCPLMEPAARRLAAELEGIEVATPKVPVVSNVDAEPNRESGRIKDLLVRQVTAPVQWERCVRRLGALGVTDVVEVGCGRTLSALIRRIERKQFTLRNTATVEDVKALIESARAS